jgi:hypothetical protein
MNTFVKTVCFVLLAAWGGSAVALAQTPPPAAGATNRPAATTKLPSRRYSGKIQSVDSKAKTITLQGGIKIVITITDNTRIIKAKQPATFDVLATNLTVTGIEQLDATGKWQAQTLNVGDPRQIPDEPVGKTFVPSVKTNAVKTNTVTTGGN